MEWQEPEVAVPAPAYTGQPMEEVPEGTRKRRRRAERAVEEESLEAVEDKLKSRLQTSATDKVRQESDTRTLRRSSRRSVQPVNYREGPPSPEPAKEDEKPEDLEANGEPNGEEGEGPKKPRMRRKRRSARVSAFSSLQKPRRRAADSSPTNDDAGEEEPNNDYCSACGGLGDFVCCESCPKSFHLLCVDPPMDEESLPDGAWYCKECTAKQVKAAKSAKSAKESAASKDSTSKDGTSVKQEAEEPKLTIRIKTEQGHAKQKKTRRRRVEDAEPAEKQVPDPVILQQRGLFGELLEQLQARNPQVFRLPVSLQYRFEGVVVGEEDEYVNEFELPPKKPRLREENLRLEDKDENPILCFKCHKSAMSGPIIACDKCSVPWHIDCINPLQFNLPARWVCPNHVENAAKIPRRMRQQPVRDTVLRRGHKNKGLIEVWDEEEDQDQLTRFTPALIGNVQETKDGFRAVMTKKQSEDAIYRLPARSIQLDFVDFVHARWRDPWRPTQDSNILEILNDLALKPQEEREAARNLVYLGAPTKVVDTVTATKNMETLVKVALDDHANDQALAIRQLIKAKGKAKLLAFLNEP